MPPKPVTSHPRMEGSLARLSNAARDALAVFLPTYRSSRQRWPLWTYERGNFMEAPDRWTWNSPGSWPDRLRFGPLLPVMAVGWELERAAEASGIELLAFSPGRLDVSRVADGGVGRVDLPRPLEARLVAAFAATAHPSPPDDAEELERVLPEGWKLHEPLDEQDRRALAQHLLLALVRPRSGDAAGPPSSLLTGFLRLAAEAGKKKSERSTGWEDATAGGRGRKLASELVRRSGLLTKGRGLASFSGAAVTQLRSETREIVRTVLDWTPSEAEREAAAALLPNGEPEDPLAWARWREAGEPEGGDPEAVQRLARQVRFPFLTPAELERIEKPASIETAGDELLRRRIVADVDLKTLRNRPAPEPSE